MMDMRSEQTSYNVTEAKSEVLSGIKAYMAKDKRGKYYYDVVNKLPFYLEGPPGIGKTEIVKQIAEELGIGFVSFSITHHTRNSMIGLPVIENLDNGSKYTEYTMSEIIAAVMREKEKGAKEGILLLDEFNCASETIMPVMLAFLQTRNIGLYRLPDEWAIVLCGNPSEFNDSAKRFSAAITDRVRRLDIVPDTKCFLDYAEKKEYHPLILKYLELFPENLYRVKNDRSNFETVTARGWENLSHTINVYEECGIALSLKTIMQFIKSYTIASDFWTYYWLNKNSFSEEQMQQVINGKYTDELVESFREGNTEFINSAVEIIEKGLTATMAYETSGTMSKKISNVFGFLDRIGAGANGREKFFFYITETDGLLDAVRKSGNADYLAEARKIYGMTA